MSVRRLSPTFWHVVESMTISLLLMLMLTAWINSPYSLTIEEYFIKYSSLIRSYFYKTSTDQALKEVWLVNAGSSGQLVSANFNMGDERIADRNRLDSFLLLLNRLPNERRIVLCDLSFDKSTAADSSLALHLSQTPRLFMPAFTTQTPAPFAAIGNHVKQGYADYSKSNEWWILSNKLNKFKLMTPNGKKSLPLKMFEEIHGLEAVARGPFMKIGSDYYFSMIALDEMVRSFSVNKDILSTSMPINVAIQQLKDNDEFTADYVNRPYIIIGNFENDIHQTAFGQVPGALINFNLFKSLENGENRIPWLWVLLVFVSYTGIIQYSLYGKSPKLAIDFRNWVNKYFGVILGSITVHIPLLFALSMISYFIYHISIEVIASATLLGFLFFLRKLLLNIQTARKEKVGTYWVHVIIFILTNKKYDQR